MRRRVRLTGRKQLRRHDFDVRLPELGGKRILTITPQAGVLEAFPPDARVTLRLQENKRVEIIRLGTAGQLKVAHDLVLQDFVAPSCRISISEATGDRKGVLFASTDEWTLRGSGDEDQEQRRGILQFVAADTRPQTWKLDIRADDHPVIEVDCEIPAVRTWVKNDPVFVGCVLPAVISRVLEAILEEESTPEAEWMLDWVRWVEDLMPGIDFPFGEDSRVKSEFIDQAVDAFCLRHDTANKLLASIEKAEDSR